MVVSSSRLALLALAAVVALATSVVAQTCVVTVTSYGSSDTSCSGAVTNTGTIGSGACQASFGALQYVEPNCNSFNDASSSWTLDVWSSNPCTGAYSGRVSSSGSTCATYNAGSSVGSVNYFKVNCSCSSVLPAVSSSSAVAVSSSSAMSTAMASSSTGRVIDYGCPRTINVYSDSACATTPTSYNSVYSFGCSPITIASQSAYAFLQCNSAVAASNWRLTAYGASTCTGSSYTDLTPADAAAPNACQSAAIAGLATTVYLSVNCSCYNGRHYSTGSTASLASTGMSSGVTSMTSMTSNTASLTTMSGMTSNTGSTTGSTGSTTGRTSSAPASRSSVVAIVAAAAAGVVALLA